MLKKIYYFFYVASRGYSLPTSLTSWFVCFAFCFANYQYSIQNAFVALVGLLMAHLGANLLDDCIDTIYKVPKQKCKTEYFDKGIFSLKFIICATVIYFILAFFCGLYLFLQVGFDVFVIAFVASVLILLYPRLNHYALGELAVALTFGPLLFWGVEFVMTGKFLIEPIYVSIPVALLISNLLFVHSLMDYQFDSVNSKKTLCVRFGQEKSFYVFFFIAVLTAFIHLILVSMNILNIWTLVALVPVLLFYILIFKPLKCYIETENHKDMDFMNIFKLARNASIGYNVLLAILVLLVK